MSKEKAAKSSVSERSGKADRTSLSEGKQYCSFKKQEEFTPATVPSMISRGLRLSASTTSILAEDCDQTYRKSQWPKGHGHGLACDRIAMSHSKVWWFEFLGRLLNVVCCFKLWDEELKNS